MNCTECRYYCAQGACGRGLDFYQYKRENAEPCPLMEEGPPALFTGEVKSRWDWDANHRVEQAPGWARVIKSSFSDAEASLVHFSYRRTVEREVHNAIKLEVTAVYAYNSLFTTTDWHNARKRLKKELGLAENDWSSACAEGDYIEITLKWRVPRKQEHERKINRRSRRFYDRRKNQSPSKALVEQG